MKGIAVAKEREGSRFIAVALVAFVSMLLIASFGTRPAMADPKDKDDKSSSSSDNGNSSNAPGHSEDKAEAKAEKAEDKAEAKADKAEAKEDKAESKADDDDDVPAHCTDGKGNDGNANKHCTGGDDDGGNLPPHCTDGRGNDGNANKHCQGDDDDDDNDSRDNDGDFGGRDSDDDGGVVTAPAAPSRPRNDGKGSPIVLGERLSRAGSPAVAPAVVRGARQGAALPFTGPTALIPFVALGLALMGSGSYLCRKKH